MDAGRMAAQAADEMASYADTAERLARELRATLDTQRDVAQRVAELEEACAVALDALQRGHHQTAAVALRGVVETRRAA